MNPLEHLYYLGYSWDKARGLKNRKRLPRKVISVGNITVGGTGKTPAVIAIAERAKAYGYRPCILTRGYRGKAAGPCFVSKGTGRLLGVDAAGDEAALMAERLPDVPVVKGADRYAAGVFALHHLDHESLMFILDDGFQHWGLYRDLDILLIDGSNPFGNRRLLPLGRLREPLSEIDRADVIVITRASRTAPHEGQEKIASYRRYDNLINEIRDNNPTAPLFMAEHLPDGFRMLSGAELPGEVVAGKPVVAFCGIGNPSSFKETLSLLKADVRRLLAFRDHRVYGRSDLRRILSVARHHNADWIVTTEKDIMKLREFDPPENLISVRIQFTLAERFYARIFMEADHG